MTAPATGFAQDSLQVKVKRLDHAKDLPLPSYATPGAAALDLVAAVEDEIALAPGARALVPTGLVLALPEGYEGQVRARSGLALRKGLAVLNAPGTIDCDYRGELGVILANLGQESVTVARGERIAQLVVAPVSRVLLVESEALGTTQRGAGGFGSTGLLSGHRKEAEGVERPPREDEGN